MSGAGGNDAGEQKNTADTQRFSGVRRVFRRSAHFDTGLVAKSPAKDPQGPERSRQHRWVPAELIRTSPSLALNLRVGIRRPQAHGILAV